MIFHDYQVRIRGLTERQICRMTNNMPFHIFWTCDKSALYTDFFLDGSVFEVWHQYIVRLLQITSAQILRVGRCLCLCKGIDSKSSRLET